MKYSIGVVPALHMTWPDENHYSHELEGME